MAAAAVDIGYLAASYHVPEPTLHTLLSAPTVELVQTVLAQLEAKAREFDDLKSEKLRADIELETEVRNGDTRAKALKASVDKALKDAGELREKLTHEENTRAQLDSELQALKASASQSTSEVQALESRIKTLEAQNRDAIALHETKSAAHDRLAEELSAQHQKAVALRKDVSELESRAQTLENEATNFKFREQTLKQEIELLKKNNDYFEEALKKRQEDQTKFRKEKNAQIVELQRANADASETIDSLQRADTAHRKRLEELTQRNEELVGRIQHLQDAAIQEKEATRAELNNVRRLASLHQEATNTAKAHVQELKAQLEQTNEGAAQEIGQLQAEFESERNQRELAEVRIAQLEAQIEQLETHIAGLNRPTVPGTPRRTINGGLGTPARGVSPGIFSPSKSKNALSQTQLYAENATLKVDLRELQTKFEKQSAAFSEMLTELEARQPEIDELRQENERLTNTTGEIQGLLNQALADKDAARKESRKHIGENKGLSRQLKLMEQECHDYAAQIRFLLTYQKVRDEGLQTLEDKDRQYFINRINGTVPEEDLDGTTPTGRLISRYLVVYKDVEQLQKQHAEGVKMMRNVADQYEGSEAQQKAAAVEEDKRKLAALEEKVSKSEDDIRSLTLRCQSITKERDLFRKIVTDRRQGQDADASSMLGQSLDGRASVTSPPPGGLQASQSGGPDYEKLLRDLQAHVDNLKQESATDYAVLKQQADNLAKDNSHLQRENVRLNGSIQLATERLNEFQQRYRELQANADTINNRYNTQQEIAARQDMLVQKATEDVIAAQQAKETLERRILMLEDNEKFAKMTQTRLAEENAKLQNERDQLNQKLENNREIYRETSDNQRQLQANIHSLEKELQGTKDQLEREIKAHQQISQKYESDRLTSQKSMDDYSKALNNSRLELATVKAERDQARIRVEEQKAELAMERERSLQARPAPRVNGSAGDHDGEGSSREEELSEEVEMLKSDLESARDDIRVLNGDIEKYKSIAQDVEEQLADSQNSWEEAQQAYEQQISEKDAKIQDLQQRVDEISAELATTNTELSELRRAHEDENIRFAQQKEDLDAQIARLQDDADRYKETAAMHKEDLKVQGDIAKRAQENYEHELMKHSEAMKNLQSTREEYNKLKSEVVQYKSEAEAARASLEQLEVHLVELRERHERELADHRARHADVLEQNKILHRQYENVSADIASLKSNRISVAAGDSDTVASNPDTAGLQEVISYLRREKEIVEVQYELSIQEGKRLKQQADYAQEQLDQTREKLGALQSDQAQGRQNAMSLEKMQKQVEELNLYRESTSTLRNDNRQLRTQMAEKTKELEHLNEQLQPLQARVQELDGELAIKVGELELLQQDRDHWQKRHQDVLLKYDRIDPAELEALKTQITTLQTERDEAVERIPILEAEKNEAVQKLAAETESFEKRRATIVQQAKDGRKNLQASNKQKDEALQALGLERDGLRQQLENAHAELSQAVASRDEALANLDARMDTVMNNAPEEGQVEETSGLGQEEKQALEARIANMTADLYAERNRTVEQNIKAQALESNIRRLETQIGELQQRIGELSKESSEAQDQLKQAEARVQQLQTQLTSAGAIESSGASEEVQGLREQLEASQKEIDDLRTRADIADSITADDGSKSVAEQISQKVSEAESKVAELDARVKELEAEIADERNKRAEAEAHSAEADMKASEKMKNLKEKCNKMVKDVREELRETKQKYESAAADLERFRQDAPTQTAVAENTASAPAEPTAKEPTSTVSDSVVKPEMEELDPEWDERQVKNWVARNRNVQEILSRNIKNKSDKAVKPLQENLDAALIKLKEEEEARAKLVNDQESIIAEKIKEGQIKTEKMMEMKYKIKLGSKDNQLSKAQAKIDVVEKAANETPEKPVKEVWDVAQVAKPTPAAPVPQSRAAPPSIATQPEGNTTAPSDNVQAELPGTLQTGSAQQPATSELQSAGVSQSNAPNNNTSNQAGGFGQPSFGQQQQGIRQPVFGRPAVQNPFQQHASNNQGGFGGSTNNQGGFGGSTNNQGGFGGSSNNQGGFGGSTSMPQPGFMNNSQLSQNNGMSMQTFGGSRGGGAFGTGPGALRNLQQGTQQQAQTGIPRGGGIPRPAARGGNQANTNQGGGNFQDGNARGGRGGRGNFGRDRGGRGGTPDSQGRGGGPNSPLNPGAQQFLPGSFNNSAGRGQKRGADGEGEGGSQKRPRGGRGGGGQ